MAERKYLIVPSDYSWDNVTTDALEKLHIEGLNKHNADIIALERGIEVDRVMYRPRLHRRWDAELPPVETVRNYKGKKIKETLGGKQPSEIRKGCPPIYQLIYKLCDVEQGEKKESIIERFSELGWFEGVDFAGEESVSKALEIMKNNTLITVDPDRGTYHSGPKTLDYYYDLEDDGYDIKEGPYPTVRLIKDKLSDRGTMKKYDLLDLLVDWNWVVNRKSGEKWITHSLKKKYIRHIGDGVLESYRSLDRH